jgi:hypothetical protein
LEVRGLAVGEEDAPDDGVEGAGRDRQAELGEHRLGRGVGLLRGEAALLEREVRRVAGGLDVL